MQNNKNSLVIKAKNVSVCYKLYNSPSDRMKEALHPYRKKYHKDFYALDKIDLEVKKGEILGLVGKNGSGKSTLLKVIAGVLQPTHGFVKTQGRISAILELGTGFHPNYTGLENIFFYGAMLGFSQAEMEEKVGEVVSFADIGEFISQPVKLYSSGMRSRLAFAINTAVDPDILILDEVLSVGDELFKRRCYARMEEFFKGGKTIIYVSHNVQSINELCSRTVLIDKGNIILDGPAKMVTRCYQSLLFAKGDNIMRVLDEIDQLNSDRAVKRTFIEESIVNKKGEITEGIKRDECGFYEKGNRAYFITDFVSKSVDVQRFSDVDITDIKIVTAERESVNVLVTGEYYYLTLKATFGAGFKNVQAVIVFKTAKGVNLASDTAPGLNETFTDVEDGTSLDFSWRFKCVFLRDGDYYLNISIITKENGKIEYLNRVSDAIVFKVEKSNNLSRKGLVDLEQKVVVRKI